MRDGARWRGTNRWRAAAVVALLGGGGSVVAEAQEPPEAATLRAIQIAAATSDGAYGLVRSLTTEVGPRLAGSPGDRAAVAWAERKLRELGFDRVWSEPVEVPRWVRGEAAAEIVAPYPQPLAVAALGGSPGTGGWLEGEVVAAADVAALEALPAEAVRGRIVFLHRRMERRPEGGSYGAVVANRGKGPAVAAAKGAIATVIRSVGTDDHRLPHTGSARHEGKLPAIPAAALSNPDADLLEAQLAHGGPVRLRLRLDCRDEGTAASANVIGEIAGAERPDEVVLLGAHLDSWDLGTGAEDDGAGVGVVIEAARLAGRVGGPPRRSVRVVLFANEEFGLSGGRAYAARPAGEVARHVAALESDLGSGRVRALRTRLAPADAPLAGRLAAALAPLGIPVEAKEAYGGADIGPLRRLGVPVVDLPPDASTYFDVHHSADDTFDKVSAEGLRHQVAAFATVARLLADLPVPLAHLPAEPDQSRSR